jgi:hypothetical protein
MTMLVCVRKHAAESSDADSVAGKVLQFRPGGNMTKTRLVIFAAGLVTGAGVLALYAPKSGRETRRWFGKTGTKVRKSAEHLLHRVA